MNEKDSWISKFLRVIRSAFKDEVKTPLSLFFRVITAVSAITLAAFVAAAAADRFHIFEIAIIAVFGVAVIVALFAWFKPKSLVYGESGHRAEFKLEYGTERHTLTHQEVITLQGEENPEALALEQPTAKLPEAGRNKLTGENL
jgi:hypothetical protein